MAEVKAVDVEEDTVPKPILSDTASGRMSDSNLDVFDLPKQSKEIIDIHNEEVKVSENLLNSSEPNEECKDSMLKEEIIDSEEDPDITSKSQEDSITNSGTNANRENMGDSSSFNTVYSGRSAFDNDDLSNSFYSVKWIQFQKESIPIITQNANGPCPLIALSNVLLLRKSIRLEPGTEIVTGEKLVFDISNHMINLTPRNLSEGQMMNYQQNINDALQIFPKLQTGLDVNVRFTGASDFEFTDAQCVFDVLSVPLHHGWLVDPEEKEVATVLSDLSYNQLVEKIICDKVSSDADSQQNALLAEDFLNRTASQLTYHGLIEILQTLSDGQLAVMFRNNHFSTIYKKNNCLYVLVTDISLVNEPSIVWEVLNDVDGDTQFVDYEFNVSLLPDDQPTALPDPSSNSQFFSDYELARSLQNNEDSQNDFDLAKRLQAEEDQQQQEEEMRAAAAASAATTRNPGPTERAPTNSSTNSGAARPPNRGTPPNNQNASAKSEKSSCNLM